MIRGGLDLLKNPTRRTYPFPNLHSIVRPPCHCRQTRHQNDVHETFHFVPSLNSDSRAGIGGLEINRRQCYWLLRHQTGSIGEQSAQPLSSIGAVFCVRTATLNLLVDPPKRVYFSVA